MWVDGSNACAVVDLVLFKDSNFLKGEIGLETPSHTVYCSNTDYYLEFWFAFDQSFFAITASVVNFKRTFKFHCHVLQLLIEMEDFKSSPL